MASDYDVEFIDRGYGKNYVRLLHVKREGSLHTMRELEVSTRLTLNDTKDHLHGDNSSIIATDSQKNTVYILAKMKGINTIEEFGMNLSSHFLKKYPQVIRAQIYIEETPWKRIKQGVREHVHAFVQEGDCTRFCEVIQEKHEVPKVSAGLKDLKVLKTTQSAFVNFVKDEFRSLPDMADRVFCTVIYSKWNYYTLSGLDFDRAWQNVKNSLMDTFAGPSDKGVFSPSVQKTMYDSQKLAMVKVPQISDINVELPNVHAYEFDFSKYPALGLQNNGEVFQPTDKPSGNIQATLKRRVQSKL